MTKYDTETASLRPKDYSSKNLLRLLKQKPLNKKDQSSMSSSSMTNIRLLKEAVKGTNPYYQVAKHKGIKNGYVESQVHKKLTLASKNMSRDAWTKLAIAVSRMTYDEMKAWIK